MAGDALSTSIRQACTLELLACKCGIGSIKSFDDQIEIFDGARITRIIKIMSIDFRSICF